MRNHTRLLIEQIDMFENKRILMLLDIILYYMLYPMQRRNLWRSLTLFFYENTNGDIPVQDFLLSLDNKMRAKMLLSIRLVKEYGYLSRLPYSEELEDGIFELRAKSGSNISRILYFFVVGS